ncbi:hypothetical protein Tco_1054730 [Tanacetum coccineum]|uniref:Uncharacterized protein n=1 Tax=Tanacetum coccineum TaxID=301880 RepID=A0ABQ5GXN8_9ASTR
MAKQTKPSTRIEEYKKSKRKAYSILMGQPVPNLMGPELKMRERLKGLEASSSALYKYHKLLRSSKFASLFRAGIKCLGLQDARGVEVHLTVEIVSIVPMCGYYLGEGFCSFCNFKARNSFFNYSNPNSFNDPPNFSDYPPQPQYKTYSCELCGNDSHHGYDCPPRFPLIKDYRNEKIDIRFRRECENMIDELKEQVVNISTYPSQRFKSFFYDDYDYEESSIPLSDIISELPLSVAITPDLPTLEPEDSLIMENEDLSTILEKESDEFIKSSVEDFIPILSEFEDTSESDSDCDLPSCDDFSPINIYKEKSMTFSNPLFDSNDDFTSSDDESLSDEDVLEDNVKIYSNPLFEFDDEYISSDINSLFDEVLENIESKDSYVSNLDEPALLVTPLSDANEDECFDPGGEIVEIDVFLDMDIFTDIENDHDPRSLKDELDKEDLKSMDCPDLEDSRARGFFHHSLDLQSLACLFMRIQYGVLGLDPLWSLVKCRHRYTVYSLMDTAYWMSEQ